MIVVVVGFIVLLECGCVFIVECVLLLCSVVGVGDCLVLVDVRCVYIGG